MRLNCTQIVVPFLLLMLFGGSLQLAAQESPASVAAEKAKQLATKEIVPPLYPQGFEQNDPILMRLYEGQGAWRNFKPGDEILAKRDAYSKHFRNDDGTITGVFSSGAMHYLENGQFKTSSNEVVPYLGNYPFANLHNAYKTYYGNSGTGIKVTKADGVVTLEGLMAEEMVFMDEDFHLMGSFQTAQSGVQPTALPNSPQRNDLIYRNILGTGVDFEVSQQSGRLKTQYTLRQAVLPASPAGAEYVAFTDQVIVPVGTTVKEETDEKGAVSLVARWNGELILRYDHPYYYDAKDGSIVPHQLAVMKFSQQGQELKIYTVVPLGWLNDSDRQYPISVDPVITVFPNATTWWSGTTNEDADPHSTEAIKVGFYDCPGCDDEEWHPWAKFNISALPDADVSSINSVDVEMWQNGFANGNGNDCLRFDIGWANTDPVPDPWATIRNAIQGLSERYTQWNVWGCCNDFNEGFAGWDNFLTNTAAHRNRIFARMGTDYITLGLDQLCGNNDCWNCFNSETNELTFDGWASGNRPRMTINYLQIGETFGNPIVVGNLCGSYSNTRSNCGYSNEFGQSSGDIYYQFSLSTTATVNISHCGSGFDTYVHLLNSGGGIIVANDDQGPLCAGNNASLQVTLGPGTYYVVSEGWNTGCGNINTQLSVVTPTLAYPSNSWTLFGYNGGGYNTLLGSYNGGAPLNFNTANCWGTGGSPSDASGCGYNGCAIPADNHSYRALRQGFPCGVYQINAFHDDGAYMELNGVQVYSNGACCNTFNAGTYFLGPSTQVLFGVSEIGGASQLALTFNTVGVTVNGGAIGGVNTTICTDGDPGVFTNITSGSGGTTVYSGGGSISYQWESSPNGSSWSDIGGQTGATYDPPTLNSTIYYRRRSFDVCGNVGYSNVVQITVVADPTVSISGAGTICNDGWSSRTLTANISNGTGSYNYQWQSGPSAGGPWTNVGGNSNTYNTGALAATTFYQVIATNTNGSLGCNTTISAAVQVTVTQPPGNPSVYGVNTWNIYTYQGSNFNNYVGFATNATSTEFNIGAFGMGVLQNPSILPGYSGCTPQNNDNWSINAKRQGFPCGVYNIIGRGHDDGVQVFVDANGDGTFEYTSPNFTCCNQPAFVNQTLYTGTLTSASRVQITFQEGGGDAYVDVDFTLATPALNAGSINGAQTICMGGDPNVLGNASSPSGGAGTYTYDWEYRDNCSGGYTSLGVNALTYDPPAGLTVTRCYRRRVTDICGNTQVTGDITVTAVADPAADISGAGTICNDGWSSRTLTANISNGTGSYNYQWQSGPSAGGPWTNVGGNSNTYNTGALAATTFYQVIATNTNGSLGCNTTTSAAVQVTVTQPPGNPTVYGVNTWNIYTYQGLNFENYVGFASNATSTEFNLYVFGMDSLLNPSVLPGYSGCTPQSNNQWSFYAKRQGFPCGVYNIIGRSHDASVQVFVDADGDGTFEYISPIFPCCNQAGFVNQTLYSGTLISASRVQIAFQEGNGPAYLDIDFNLATPALNAGSINGTQTICSGGDPSVLGNAGSPSGGAGTFTYDWEYRDNCAGGYTSLGVNALTYDPPAGLTVTRCYRRRVTDICGNTQVTGDITVTTVADPAAPTATASPAVGTVCAGATLTLASPSLGAGGTGTCTIEYRSRTGGGIFSGWSATLPSVSAAVGINEIEIRTNCGGAGCDISPTALFTWIAVADPAPPSATPSPAVGTVCAGQLLTVGSPVDGGGGTGTCVFEYRFRVGGGSYSGWSATIPNFAAGVGSNDIEIRRNCNGTGCDNSSATIYTWTGVADPAAPTATPSPAVGNRCPGTVVTVTSPVIGAGGTGNCIIEYRTTIGGVVGAWSPTIPSFAIATGTNSIQMRTNCDGLGCDISTTTTYTWTGFSAPTAVAYNEGEYCDDDLLELYATGGASYSWSGPGGYTSNLQSAIRNPAVAGDYTVTVTDANGCTASAITTVVVNPDPVATASNTGPYCVGQTITLNAGPAGQAAYDWSGPNGFATTQIYTQNFNSLIQSGSTTWTNNSTLAEWYAASSNLGTNGLVAQNGSSNTGNLISFGTTGSNERALGSIASGSTNTLNYGTRIVNTTGEPITTVYVEYTGEQWRNGGINGGTPCVVNLLDFSYKVGAATITEGGYTDENTLDFTGPIADNSNTGIALDGNLVIYKDRVYGFFTLGTPIPVGGNIWLRWTDGNSAGNDQGLAIDDLTVILSNSATQTIANASLVNAGNYTVTVTSEDGCSATATTLVEVNPNPTGTTSVTNVLCFGQSNGAIDLTPSGAASYTYLWSNGATTQDISGLAAGTYTVTITSGLNCIGVVTATVNQPPLLVSGTCNLAGDPCFADAGSVTIQAAGGTAPYTVTYTPNNGTPASGFTILVSGGQVNVSSLLGGTTYSFTVTDSNGCQNP